MWQNGRVSDEANVLQRLASALRRVEEVLSYLPDGKARSLREKIATVRGVLLEQRPPRLVLIGRRGAGKSSLINAFFGAKVAEVGHVKSRTGQGRWYDYTSPSGTLSILDTRGVQEGSAPDEGDKSRGAVASIVLELKKKAPDLIVFLVKATEVDAAIDGDLQALQEVIEELDREHKTKPPLIAVATHCDLLEPKSVRLHEPDAADHAELEEKLVHVAAAERLLATKLRTKPALAAHLSKTMGVSSYLSFRADGSTRADERWRVDALCEAIFRALPESGRGMFVRISRVRALQDELAGSLTRASAALCAAFAALPIPVADIVPLTTIQVALVAGIAWVSGRSLDLKSAGEFLSSLGVNVGAAFALRETARALIKYVFPGAGSAVSGAIAFTGTMAIGAAARAYYLRGASLEEAKREFARARDEAEHDPEAPAPEAAPAAAPRVGNEAEAAPPAAPAPAPGDGTAAPSPAGD
jgi:predicted GTPase